VEQAIKSRIQSFLEKRRAGGDAWPSRPPGLAPIYAVVYGVSKNELQDERYDNSHFPSFPPSSFRPLSIFFPVLASTRLRPHSITKR
jgi:hypothetical protein